MPKIAAAKLEKSNQERLIAAAIRCIEKYGISKTFVDDIATEAGLSRPTAYRTFASRKTLLEGVAAYRVNSIKNMVKIRLRRYATFADALAVGSTESLALARKDRIFMAVVEALGDEGLERYLLDPSGPVYGYTRDAFKESFEKARTSGELRGGVTDDELTTLICAANCFFLLRDDFSKQGQIDFLRKFLVPSVTVPGVSVQVA